MLQCIMKHPEPTQCSLTLLHSVVLFNVSSLFFLGGNIAIYLVEEALGGVIALASKDQSANHVVGGGDILCGHLCLRRMGLGRQLGSCSLHFGKNLRHGNARSNGEVEEEGEG